MISKKKNKTIFYQMIRITIKLSNQHKFQNKPKIKKYSKNQNNLRKGRVKIKQNFLKKIVKLINLQIKIICKKISN